MNIPIPETLKRARSHHLRTAVGVILVATPLALGGVQPAVNGVVALALLAVLLVANARGRLGFQINLPIVMVAVALGATVLQLVPMPVAWMKGLSPGTHNVLAGVWGRHGDWAPLSLDPPATSHEVVKLTAYLAAAILAAGLFSRGHERKLLKWVAISGTVVAGLGYFQALARLDRPFGVLGYANPSALFVSSFVNPNHLAGFLGLTSIVAAAVGATAHSRPTRWGFIAAATLSGAGVFLSLSRGGILSFAAALVFLGAMAALRRYTRSRTARVATLGLGGAMLVASYVAYSRVLQELATLTDERAFFKAEIWKPVPAMLRDFPLLGVGKGAFFAAYPGYQDLPLTRVLFSHLENEWLQPLVDLGPVVGGLLLLGGLIAVAQLLLDSERDLSAHLVAVALVYVGLQNMGDFNLQDTAVALPCVMLLSALSQPLRRPLAGRRQTAPAPSRGSSGERPDRARAWYLPQPLRQAWMWVLLVGVVLATLVATTRPINRSRRHLTDVLATPGVTAAGWRDAGLTMARWHPADHLSPLLVAQRLNRRRGGARAALAWSERGTRLAPTFHDGYVLRAAILARLGRWPQAFAAYRRACELGPPHLAAKVFERTWAHRRRAEDVTAVAASLDLERRVRAAHFLVAQDARDAAIRLLHDAWQDAEPKAATLIASIHARAGSWPVVRRLAETLEQQWPTHAQAYVLQARAARVLRELEDAEAILGRGLAYAENKLPIMNEAYSVAMAARDIPLARRRAEAVLRQAGSPGQRAAGHSMLGRTFERESRYAEAMRHHQRARDAAPQSLHYRLVLAGVMERTGRYGASLAELQKARVDLGANDRLDAAIARVADLDKKAQEKLRWEVWARPHQR